MADARDSVKYSEKRKGISVFDFDDTLAQSNSNVLYTMPDGTTGSLTAGEFALEASYLAINGAEFDFSEFNEVKEGRKGPLADVALKRQDINKERMVIRIVRGKGQKDRYVPLSPMMLEQIELYYEKYKPVDYIFSGRKEGEPICRATVNRIIRNANYVLDTKETITPHTFRHSFATMLTEEGESLYKIQQILGHKSIHSTTRYIKAAKTELKSCINPLDKVYEDNSI